MIGVSHVSSPRPRGLGIIYPFRGYIYPIPPGTGLERLDRWGKVAKYTLAPLQPTPPQHNPLRDNGKTRPKVLRSGGVGCKVHLGPPLHTEGGVGCKVHLAPCNLAPKRLKTKGNRNDRA